MDIFISWSGTRSRKVAELLKGWLKCVIQAANPWVSAHDIDRGTVWFSTIAEKLSRTKFGIICLTQENKNQPWILFEAGAIAKGVAANHVCTLLIDLEPTEVENPLAQFNHTVAGQRQSMWELVRTINKQLQDEALPEQILTNVFGTYWPQFDRAYRKILSEEVVTPEKRSQEDLLSEILSTVRSVGRQVQQVEADNRFIRGRLRWEKIKEYQHHIELIRQKVEAKRKFQEQMEEEMTRQREETRKLDEKLEMEDKRRKLEELRRELEEEIRKEMEEKLRREMEAELSKEIEVEQPS